MMMVIQMMNSKIKILISLGYRKMIDNLYGKPIAQNLFCFKIEENEFVNCVIGINGEVLIWNKETFNDEISFIDFIKDCEGSSHIETLLKSDFEFLTREEQLNFLINNIK